MDTREHEKFNLNSMEAEAMDANCRGGQRQSLADFAKPALISWAILWNLSAHFHRLKY